MGFLKGLRMAVLLLIMIVAIGFAVLNPGERVVIDLFFAEPFQNVPLVFVLFCAFLVGVFGGFAVALVRILELQASLRNARRSRLRVEDELSTLRNLPLEENDEVTSQGAIGP